jgi:hypothetical protein
MAGHGPPLRPAGWLEAIAGKFRTDSSASSVAAGAGSGRAGREEYGQDFWEKKIKRKIK